MCWSVGAGERPKVAQRLGVAEAEVALGVARLQERLAEDRGERGGDVRHRAAHHGGQLEERSAVEAGVEERLRVARQLAAPPR